MDVVSYVDLGFPGDGTFRLAIVVEPDALEGTTGSPLIDGNHSIKLCRVRAGMRS